MLRLGPERVSVDSAPLPSVLFALVASGRALQGHVCRQPINRPRATRLPEQSDLPGVLGIWVRVPAAAIQRTPRFVCRAEPRFPSSDSCPACSSPRPRAVRRQLIWRHRLVFEEGLYHGGPPSGEPIPCDVSPGSRFECAPDLYRFFLLTRDRNRLYSGAWSGSSVISRRKKFLRPNSRGAWAYRSRRYGSG